MANEIERKYLVTNDEWRVSSRRADLRQGYISRQPGRSVRVRTQFQEDGEGQAFLTLKGSRQGITRPEFEYEISISDAIYMLNQMCEKPLIEKTRHFVDYAGLTWEVDEFRGENAGLIVAEVELKHADQPIELPPWIGKEVTNDNRYYNSQLVLNPYNLW